MQLRLVRPRRRQRPVKGGRQYLAAGLIAEIEREVDRASARFRVSRSFVIAVALADYFGIEEQERFIAQPRSGRVVEFRTKAG
jgi:hypothetical protein